VTLGYELRCARPIPFDIDYTRTLGYGAIHFLLSEPEDERLRYGGLVCLDFGRLRVLSFDEIRDPVTGRTHGRLVDIGSEHYNVAREYMIRLEPRDFEDPEMLGKLAAAANMTPEEFETTFAHVTGLSGSKAPARMGTAR
jgi:6-phosphofructokinase 1